VLGAFFEGVRWHGAVGGGSMHVPRDGRRRGGGPATSVRRPRGWRMAVHGGIRRRVGLSAIVSGGVVRFDSDSNSNTIQIISNFD
jgi:hypothetical protein